jgi:ATP-dependent Clp protease ATP-binding subunit ClpA
MHVPKINVYLPDDLADAVKEAGVPVSAICQRALEAAVRRVTAIREAPLGGADLADPAGRLAQFTERARTVLKLAADQARAAGAAGVSTEHLLGGMLAEGSNLALQVLRALEIEPEQVRRELDRQAVPAVPAPATAAEPAVPATADLRFDAAAANALELAVTEALGLGHNYVGCEHFLLGLVAEPDGTAGHVLRAMGAEQRLTRRAVAAALAGYVHLRAQAGGGAAAAGVAALVEAQLRPLVQRLDRLEKRVGAA